MTGNMRSRELIWPWKALIIIFIIFYYCVFNQACLRSIERDQTSDELVLLRMQNDMRVDLPRGSKIDNFLEPDRLVDPVWLAKIEFPACSFDEFKAALELKKYDGTTYNSPFRSSANFWAPTNIVFGKKYLADDETFVEIVIARTNSLCHAYIECVVF